MTFSAVPEAASFDGLSGSVDAYRALIIQDNVKMVREHNSKPDVTFRMEAYPMFAGLTLEEARARYFMRDVEAAFKIVAVEGHKAPQEALKAVRANVDLSRMYGTPVQNQGACGNCYAFSTTDSINMVNKRYMNYHPLLSAQELADCSSSPERKIFNITNLGCSGGNIFLSMEYVRSYGVSSLVAYPLSLESVSNGRTQPCRTVNAHKYRIRNWRYFTDGNCLSRMAVLQSGIAISVGVAGGNNNFMYYKSGILPGCGARAQIDHAVVMVGVYYNDSNLALSFFILKNSWKVTWGENGKIRIGLSADICFVCVYGTFATQ